MLWLLIFEGYKWWLGGQQKMVCCIVRTANRRCLKFKAGGCVPGNQNLIWLNFKLITPESKGGGTCSGSRFCSFFHWIDMMGFTICISCQFSNFCEGRQHSVTSKWSRSIAPTMYKTVTTWASNKIRFQFLNLSIQSDVHHSGLYNNTLYSV